MILKELKQIIEKLSDKGDNLEIKCTVVDKDGNWTDVELVSVGQYRIVPNATLHLELTHGEWFKG